MAYTEFDGELDDQKYVEFTGELDAPVKEKGFLDTASEVLDQTVSYLPDRIANRINTLRGRSVESNIAEPKSVLQDKVLPEPKFDPVEAEKLSRKDYAEQASMRKAQKGAPSVQPATGKEVYTNERGVVGRAADLTESFGRSAAAGTLQLGSDALGAVGADGIAKTLSTAAKGNQLATKEIDAGIELRQDTGLDKYAPQILAQLPQIGLAMLSGGITLPAVLSGLGSYSDAREQGKSPLEAMAYAIPMGAMEAIGEKIGGTGKLADAFEDAISKGFTKEAAQALGKQAMSVGLREVPSEETTYAGQYVIGDVANVNPVSDQQFLQGAADTAIVSAGAGGIIGGTGALATQLAAPKSAADYAARELSQALSGEFAPATVETLNPNLARVQAQQAIAAAATPDDAIAAFKVATKPVQLTSSDTLLKGVETALQNEATSTTGQPNGSSIGLDQQLPTASQVAPNIPGESAGLAAPVGGTVATGTADIGAQGVDVQNTAPATTQAQASPNQTPEAARELDTTTIGVPAAGTATPTVEANGVANVIPSTIPPGSASSVQLRPTVSGASVDARSGTVVPNATNTGGAATPNVGAPVGLSTGTADPSVVFKTPQEAQAHIDSLGASQAEIIKTGVGYVVAPKAAPDTIKARKSDATAIEQLNAGISQTGELSTVERYVPDNNDSPAVQAVAATIAQANRVLNTAYGTGLIPVKGTNGNGVSYAGRVFVDVEQVADAGESGLSVHELAIHVTGHELAHNLEKGTAEDKADYATLAAVVEKYRKPGVLKARTKAEDASSIKFGGKAKGEKYAAAEIVADVNGKMWRDPEFWGKLYDADNGSTMRRIAYKFMQAMTKVISVAKGVDNYDVDTLVTNVEQIREVAAKVWANRAMRTGKAVSLSTAKTTLFPPSFQRRRVDVDEIESGMPVGSDETAFVNTVVDDDLGNPEEDDLQAELDMAQGIMPPVQRSPLEPPAAEEISKGGLHPERLFDKYFEVKDAGAIFDITNGLVGIQVNSRNKIDISTNSSWLHDVDKEVAIKFAKRQLAQSKIAAANFDIASAYRKGTIYNLVSQWQKLAGVKGLFKLPKSGKSTEFTKIAKEMKAFPDYDLTSVGINSPRIYFKSKATGKTFNAELRFNPQGKSVQCCTMGLEGSAGLGTRFYAVASEMARLNGLRFMADHQLSGINSARRTEQALSYSLKTGDTGVIYPGKQNRVYGYKQPKTPEDHVMNIGRLLLASMRNVIEVDPNIRRLTYQPDTDTFKDAKGNDAESIVKAFTDSEEAKAYGMGRTTVARAVVTSQILTGKFKAETVKRFKAPIAYSRKIGMEGRLDEAYGEPGNLSPEFEAWFQDSKVVDADGNPLVVYHGTAIDLKDNAFNENLAKSEGGAFYFSHSPLMKNPSTNANEYAAGRAGDSQQVIPVFLSMQNPLISGFTEPMPSTDSQIEGWLSRMSDFNRSIDDTKERYYQRAIREARANGNDGVIIKNVEDVPNDLGRRFTEETDVYIVFIPNQIKSVFNTGSWSKDTNDISYSRKKNADYDYAATVDKKHERIRRFDTDRNDILAKLDRDASIGREAASVLRLMAVAGFRIGGDVELSGKHQAFGASTLKPSHVKINGSVVSFDFIGKAGVRQQHSIDDPVIAKDLAKRMDREKLFNVADRTVRNYFTSIIAGKDYIPHDFRTWVATNAAKRIVAAYPNPSNEAEFWHVYDLAIEAAASKIGDTKKVAEESYVDKSIFDTIRETSGVPEGMRRGASKARRETGNPAGVGKENARVLQPEEAKLARTPSQEDIAQAEAYQKENGILPYLSEYVEIEAAPSFSRREGGGNGQDPVTGLWRNGDGTVNLYLHTTNEEARRVHKEKTLRDTTGDGRIYLTDESSGWRIVDPKDEGTGVGGVVMVKVDPSLLNIDKFHEDGSKDFFIPTEEGAAFKAKMQLWSIYKSRKESISADATVNKVADEIKRATDDWTASTPAQKRALLKDATALLRSEHNVGTLLTENGKLESTRNGEFGLTDNDGRSVDSLGLGLAAAQKLSDAWKTTCPNSASCEGSCLGDTAGGSFRYGGAAPKNSGFTDPTAFRAGARLQQYLKTEALIVSPYATAIKLHGEIESLLRWDGVKNRADKVDKNGEVTKFSPAGYSSAIRLNVTSDIPPKVYASLMDAYSTEDENGNPKVTFYDYTKLAGYPVAKNHHLTYSSTGVSQIVDGERVLNKHQNWSKMTKMMDKGYNIAMAFSSDNHLPDFVVDEVTGKKYQVWDGDNYDARHLDPPRKDGIGMVIGLTKKDSTLKQVDATKKSEGFFVDYNRKRDGDTVVIKNQDELAGKTLKGIKVSAPMLERGADNQVSTSARGEDALDQNDTPAYSRKFTKPVQGNNFILPGETATSLARRKVQDFFLPVLEVQNALLKQGGIVGEEQNIYRAEERMHGRIEEAIKDFNRSMFTPMVEKATKFGINMDELALFAYAKHAPERNAHIASIDKKLPDGGSGMTDQEAADIIDAFRTEGKFDKLEELHGDLMDITAANRKMQLDEDLISQDEYDALENAYEFYVPLRGFAERDDDDAPTPRRGGRGFNVRGKENMKALGRTSRAGDLIENVASDIERTIVRGERNTVAKVFLDLVQNNPDPRLWEIDAVKTRKSLDRSTGKIARDTVIDVGPDTIAIKLNGKEVYVKVADQRFLDALRIAYKDENNALPGFMNAVLNGYASLMRNTLTRFNPAFAAVNAVRDFGMASVGVVDELGFKGQAAFMKNYAGATRASWRNERGTQKQDDWGKWFEEFRYAGGTTGGYYARGVEDIAGDIRDLMLMHGAAPKGKIEWLKANGGYKMAKKAGRVLEILGATSENAARVAAYRTAREMGKSPAEAASIAKNLTTNFNRKGEWGQALNTMYVFFNAAVQGSARTLKALKNPKVQGLMAGAAAAGFAMAMFNAGVGGDDDDGQAYWDKIPDFEKERNFIIMLQPGTKMDGASTIGKDGRYFKIPMPYGFSIFPVIGQQIADVMRNANDSTRGITVGKASVNYLNAIMGSFNPIGGAIDPSSGTSWLMAAMPSVVDVGVQMATGVNAFNRPTSPTKSPYDTGLDSENVNPRQAGAWAHKTARFLNKASGGNEVEAGAMDITPGTIENVWRNATGGTGVFISDVINLAFVKPFADEADITVRDMPVIKSFFSVVDEVNDASLMYERRKDIIDAVATDKRYDAADMERKSDKDFEALLDLGGVQASYTKQMSRLRKEEIAIALDETLTASERKKQIKEVQTERNEAIKEFNIEFMETMRAKRDGAYD